jgi:hypothetical protein
MIFLRMQNSNLAYYLLFFLLVIPLSLGFYSIDYDCPQGCVHGRTVEWTIELENLGARDLYIVRMYIIDAESKEEIAVFHDAVPFINDPSALGMNKSKEVRVIGGGIYTANVSSILPYSNFEGNLAYNFCMSKRASLEGYAYVPSASTFCYPTNHVLLMTECIVDEECGPSHYCSDNKCLALECGYCQYIENHSCRDHECCVSDECSLTHHCIDNRCIELECIGGEILADHNCSITPCADGEIIIDLQCVDADCRPDEHIINYSCERLICAYDEGAINHTCVPLNCAEGLAPFNNTCSSKSVCNSNQDLVEGMCVNLNCGILMKAEKHKCLFDSLLLIEIVLFFIILSLVLLDYKKYKGKYRKKLVKMLMRQARMRKRKVLQAKGQDGSTDENKEQK